LEGWGATKKRERRLGSSTELAGMDLKDPMKGLLEQGEWENKSLKKIRNLYRGKGFGTRIRRGEKPSTFSAPKTRRFVAQKGDSEGCGG